LYRSSAEVLCVARDLCGVTRPECVVDQVNFKTQFVGTPFPWHQDASFLKPLARGRFERWGGMNAVIALDASDPGNGGFTVLGRTHTTGESKELRDAYDTSGVSDALGLFDESRLTCEALRPGDGVFFHPMLAHGSGANLSERRRRIATLWFVGSD
jgi:ectoine hydroxylase-related dioxygenase (phytanoyl-CoA dioxygenase family)